MKTNLWVTELLLALVLAMPLACKAPATPAGPAQFEVTSLNVMPLEVTAGETASITAQVKNVGGSEGIYTAVLTVDGATAEVKEVTVAPGATQTVTFTVIKDKAGTYQIAVGELRSSLVVKEKKPALVAKEMELKYDDWGAEEYVPLPETNGCLVDFLPPSTPFTVNRVDVYGVYELLSICPINPDPQRASLKIEIRDKDWRVLHSVSLERSYVLPILSCPAWLYMPVPNVDVSDKFYIHIYDGRGKCDAIHVGVDRSSVNQHSTITDVAKRTPRICSSWPFTLGDKSKTNWMIRVVGTAMVPEE